MRISVFGLGKLGAVLAALHANKGHQVIGVDINQSFVDSINQGISPHLEPGLQELISQSEANLSATIDANEAVLNSDASYLIVPTPSDENGIFTNKYVIDVMKQIGSTLKNKNSYHVVVINSTVMPGSCDAEIKNALEESSGKLVGKEIGLVYSPEFIALGSVVKDMKFPDLVLIGESDKRAGDLAEQVAKSVVESQPEIHRMTLVNAEIVKIAINTFVTTKISFANMLSEICDHLPNADVDVVTSAVGSDTRVGKKYLKGALGYGGPCFPRDNIALTRLAQQLGAGFDVPEATDAINQRQVSRVANLVTEYDLQNKKIAILGLSYKPDTPVIDESQGVMIANLLSDRGSSVSVNDPLALNNAKEKLNGSIDLVQDLYEIVSNSEVLIITTPWKEYLSLNNSHLKNKVIIDCWRIFDESELPDSTLIYPGRSSLIHKGILI